MGAYVRVIELANTAHFDLARKIALDIVDEIGQVSVRTHCQRRKTIPSRVANSISVAILEVSYYYNYIQ